MSKTYQHYEQLWEAAEQSSIENTSTKNEILIAIKEELQKYLQIDNIPSKEIQNILKTKKMGEILFKLAQISRIDNINTFAALQMEVRTLEQQGSNSNVEFLTKI